MNAFRPKIALRWLLLAAGLAGPAAAQAPDLKPAANLIAENIPPIPAALIEDVGRYTESRSATFASWHPQKLEMLIRTRFGNTAQIHHVAAPLGMRRQLTFFDEPVIFARYDRIKGDFFLFLRDQGGNEFSQIYRYDFKDGRVTLLSDGGRSQNRGIVWSTC